MQHKFDTEPLILSDKTKYGNEIKALVNPSYLFDALSDMPEGISIKDENGAVQFKRGRDIFIVMTLSDA